MSNTPNISQDFSAAAEGRGTERSESHESQTGSHDIATAAELNKLESERPVPSAAPHLTPTDVEMRDVNERLNQQREDRIDHLQDRLGEAKDRFERNFERSK
jgi:hypothetical protein